MCREPVSAGADVFGASAQAGIVTAFHHPSRAAIEVGVYAVRFEVVPLKLARFVGVALEPEERPAVSIVDGQHIHHGYTSRLSLLSLRQSSRQAGQ